MNHFFQNIGEDWFTYGSIYTEMIHQFKNGSHFVEIGSWRGRSTSYMGVEIINSGYDIKFDCIDTWEGSIEHENHFLVKESKLWEEFNRNIEPVKHVVNPIKMNSVDASKLYEDYSLDFIFIDAGHDYKDVVNDILNWIPKLKINGVIGGHDYLSKDNTKCCAGVNRAVDEIFNKNEIIIRNHSWLVNKRTPHRIKLLL